MLLRVCSSPSSFFNLRPLHLLTSSPKLPFGRPSLRREFRLIPSRSSSSSSSFHRMESPPASSSSQTPVTASETDSLAKDLQNQNLGASVDEGGAKIKRKLEDFNWDHSFVKELPGDPRSDVTSREVNQRMNLLLCGLICNHQVRVFI